MTNGTFLIRVWRVKRIMTKHIPIYAHRGASGYAFENTFEAFEKARKLKADGIELDVQLSEDGVCFVFHDISLEDLQVLES